MNYGARIGALAALAAATVTVATPAGAVVRTFAQYTQATGGNSLRWVKTTSGGHLFSIASNSDTVATARRVDFTFQVASLSGLGTLAASYKLDLVAPNGHPAVLNPTNGQLMQGGLSGSFSFLSINAFTIGTTTYAAGTNLLSGTIGADTLVNDGATIAGGNGGTSGSVGASTLAAAPAQPTLISYYSDVLTFAPGSDYDFSLALSQINPVLNRPSTTQSLRSFRAASTGTFSSNPRPVVDALPPVPEPATWGMMVIGFSLLGHQMRRRKADKSLAL